MNIRRAQAGESELMAQGADCFGFRLHSQRQLGQCSLDRFELEL